MSARSRLREFVMSVRETVGNRLLKNRTPRRDAVVDGGNELGIRTACREDRNGEVGVVPPIEGPRSPALVVETTPDPETGGVRGAVVEQGLVGPKTIEVITGAIFRRLDLGSRASRTEACKPRALRSPHVGPRRRYVASAQNYTDHRPTSGARGVAAASGTSMISPRLGQGRRDGRC